MTSFNAGSIDAKMVLNRYSWVKDLRETHNDIKELQGKSIEIVVTMDDDRARATQEKLEADLEALHQTTYTPDVDLQTASAESDLQIFERRLQEFDQSNYSADISLNTAGTTGEVSQLDALLAAIERNITIDVNIDSAAAEAKLIELSLAVQRLALSDPTIDIDVDGYATAIAQLSTLEAQVAAVDGNDIRIGVDYDQASLKNLVGSGGGGGGGGGGGSLGLLKILLITIIGLLPVLAVAVSATGAVLVAFAAALVAAIFPAVIAFGGLYGLIVQFNTTPIKDRTPEMRAFAKGIQAVKDAYKETLALIDAAGGYQLMADGLQLVAHILPTLAPIFDATVDMLGDMLDGIKKFVHSSEYDEMIQFFTGFGVDMLKDFLKIGGNLLQFFGRLFQAIAPFARTMMNNLTEATAGWSDWADDLEHNKGFQDWIDRALEYGPKLLDLLGSIWDAFMQIGEAIEPFAGPMLDHLTMFFDLIANTDPSVLRIVAAGLAAIWTVMNVLVPILSVAIPVIEGLGAVLAVAFSPIGLIVLAIAGLIAMIVYLFNTNEDFRDGIIETWQAIVDTVKPIIEEIWQLIQDNWGPIKDWAADIWESVSSIIFDTMQIIEQLVRTALDQITFVWEHFGDNIIQIIKGAAQAMGGEIRGFFRVLKGIFQVISGLLTGDWSKAWEGLKNIFLGFKDFIVSTVKGWGNILAGLFRGIGTALKMAWKAGLDKLKGDWNDFRDWIGDKLIALINFFGNVKINAGGMWDGIKEGFRDMLNAIVGWWNSLSLSVDIPDKIPGLPDSFTVTTPHIDYFAEGGYITKPTLGVIGEGRSPEIIAPEPKLIEIVSKYGGGNIDYAKMASAIATAIAAIVPGVTKEDLERLIGAAGMTLQVDARTDNSSGDALARRIAYELKVMGYGGVANG